MIDVIPAMPPTEVIASKLVACGLDRAAVSVTWEAESESALIVIRRDAPVSAGQFSCIHDAAGVEFVAFDDKAVGSAYDAYADDLARPRMLAEATAAVTKLGLIEAFPKRADYRDLRDYGRELERHCGLKPGSALRVAGQTLAFDPSRKSDGMDFATRYEKLFAAIMYATATGDLNGFDLIGNDIAGSR
jgi:hypothetical protein